MSKTLYVFGGSVWAAVAELAALELGYVEGTTITTKTVNLVEGENFAPSFIALNPNATLPTLESDGKVYTNTEDVVACLVKDAPVKVKTGTPSIIATIHDEKYDPNFAMFLARNNDELAAKSNGLPGIFLSSRQPALEKYAQHPDAAPFKVFYEDKLAFNGGMLALFTGKAPEEHKAGFFAKSEAHFASVKAALYDLVPGFLPESGFIGGAAPGEDDFHVGAWVTRIAATCGATSSEDALAAFKLAFGGPVPANVAAYWGAWTERTSWKTVYATALH
ncbi:hypothetical protein B0H19DRAFT_918542 [Mycena capillaripes]|nr:hypothetical protein B0H19DRAFT_918542 [Mycena capillaripes]